MRRAHPEWLRMRSPQYLLFLSEGRLSLPQVQLPLPGRAERFFEEYSYEEIAMKLELPLGTVKTQIHRAREQMCRLIAADEKS